MTTEYKPSHKVKREIEDQQLQQGINRIKSKLGYSDMISRSMEEQYQRWLEREAQIEEQRRQQRRGILRY